MNDREKDTLIPLVDLAALHARVAEQAEAGVQAVLRSGQYVGGPVVTEFERAMAQREGTTHAVGVANGTDAIALVLRALGVGTGDEVVIRVVAIDSDKATILRFCHFFWQKPFT